MKERKQRNYIPEETEIKNSKKRERYIFKSKNYYDEEDDFMDEPIVQKFIRGSKKWK